MADSSNLSNQPNNPLSKKLNKILDTRIDSDKVLFLMRTLVFNVTNFYDDF